MAGNNPLAAGACGAVDDAKLMGLKLDSEPLGFRAYGRLSPAHEQQRETDGHRGLQRIAVVLVALGFVS